ncbi:MAG: hypothetical protein ACYTDW_10085, partial [Planctomycetota bacterium]
MALKSVAEWLNDSFVYIQAIEAYNDYEMAKKFIYKGKTMKKILILIIAVLIIALPENIILADKAGINTGAEQKLAQTILTNPDLELVLKKARKLLKSGLRAGTGYREVWIRDLNTFIELALDVQKQKDLR